MAALAKDTVETITGVSKRKIVYIHKKMAAFAKYADWTLMSRRWRIDLQMVKNRANISC